jgi:adenylate kinase
MVLLFLGPSGSGKDTQADLLKNKLNAENISTGDMFRVLYEEGDPLGIEAQKVWSKGLWNPDEQVFELLGKWLKRFDSNKSWNLIGAIRRPTQIPMLDNVLQKLGKNLDYVIHFSLPEESAIERLSYRWVCKDCKTNFHEKYKPEKVKGICDKCGGNLFQRDDDKPDAIKSRMQEYEKTIKPIREAYEKRKIWIDIDASPSIEEIHKIVCERLGLK